MIIFQILAGILLIPLAIVALIIFNLYLINWIYLLFILIFAAIFSGLCGLVFYSFNVAVWVFTVFTILYTIQMIYLVVKLPAKDNEGSYPLIRGRIWSREDKLFIAFLFPLSFLKIIKLMPTSISKKIAKQTRLGIAVPELIELIFKSCRGTYVNIKTEDADIFFEIK